jgi:acetoin utilization deacetylase AcuC-like enzyme/GNAT superfamily N-acetyltransferase
VFRIRQIYDDTIPVNKTAIAQVQEIMRARFTGLRQDEIAKLPERLKNPLRHGFRSILFVAEGSRGIIKGFAFVLHEPDLDFSFLDYLSSTKQLTGRGVGGALYERIRFHALESGCTGLFFECLPDDPQLCRDPAILKQNITRLKFYERYGARPITGTDYETPLRPDDDNPPYLVLDPLGKEGAIPRAHAREIVRAILERKYGDLCPEDYIEKVVESFRDDFIRLRPPRYVRQEPIAVARVIPPDRKIILIVNDRHDIHHIKERGYVEAPVRISTILKETEQTRLFETVPVRHFSEKYIRQVHDSLFYEYFKKVCESLEPGKSLYPYVFPIRNASKPPRELPVRAGYFCIDTFTPLNRNAYLAARRAVDCALTGASRILEGDRIAYALVRPPGHHAERRAFGGFCYFNSAAAAAHYLSTFGSVAILDLDYHHGNGQQDIFYERSDVLTLSIHGHPRFTYPYFSGFEDEKGSGKGAGFNVNYPLPEGIDGEKYREVLEKSLKNIRKFDPDFLIIALGLDTARGDPTGTWTLQARDFEENGKMVGRLHLPTLVIQEGGYNSRNLGVNARYFFVGLWNAMNP